MAATRRSWPGRPAGSVATALTLLLIALLVGPVRADPHAQVSDLKQRLTQARQRISDESAQLRALETGMDLAVDPSGRLWVQFQDTQRQAQAARHRFNAARQLFGARPAGVPSSGSSSDTASTGSATDASALIAAQLDAIGEESKGNQSHIDQFEQQQHQLGVLLSELAQVETAVQQSRYQLALQLRDLDGRIVTARALAERLEADRKLARALIDRMAILSLRAGLPRARIDALRTPAGRLGVDDQAVVRTLEAERDQLQGAQSAIATLDVRLRSSSERLIGQQADLRRGLVSARQKEIDELNRDKALADAMAALREAGNFDGPSVSGVLHVCPVDPPRSYSDDFGAPRWAGGFHLHQGNDIFAPFGAPVRAPFDGTALATPNNLGGNAVTVRGPAGYVYNAHLSGYGTLGAVHAGDVIGYVGNSGDALGGPTHDHFEWHPDGGNAVDPFPYLNAVC